MSRLTELLNSLVTVIIRYHDSQSKITKLIEDPDYQQLRNKSREFAKNVLTSNDYKFDEKLEEIIKNCTDEYEGRRPFLFFLLHEIKFLKSMQERTISFNSIQLEDYKKQVCLLLIDFKSLLTTTKHNKYTVKLSMLSSEEEHSEKETTITLLGLTNDSYWKNHYCNSGVILKEEVLGQSHNTALQSDQELQIMAESICDEHQNALLVQELEQKVLSADNEKILLAARIEILECSQKELLSKNSNLESQLNEAKEEIDTLRKQLIKKNVQENPIDINMLKKFYQTPYIGSFIHNLSKNKSQQSSKQPPANSKEENETLDFTYE